MDSSQLAADSVQLLKRALSSTACQNNGSISSDRRKRHSDNIALVQDALENAPQVPVTLTDLSEALNLEKTYCCKLFREITGESFTNWIRRIRIEKAIELLCRRRSSITDVSHAVGYADITTFERNFRKQTGLSPSDFRKRYERERNALIKTERGNV